jgi:hypothetical protein
MITLLYGAARPDRNPRVGRGGGSGPSLADTVALRFWTKLGELIMPIVRRGAQAAVGESDPAVRVRRDIDARGAVVNRSEHPGQPQ